MTRNPFITTAEAARRAGIAPSTLRKYSSTGHAPKTVIKGYYDPKEIDKWMDRRPGRGFRTDLARKAS